ncbi:hypothetical protein ABG067_001140 [Albugo candida]
MPVLGLDRRKRRHEMQNADQETRIEQVVEFAGVEYKISKRVKANENNSMTALDRVLANLNGTKKLSTMEKTSLDWDQYKEEHKLTDELSHSIKDGYLEKQNFLLRLDQRQFEIEKADRERKRRLQQLSNPN